MHDGDDFADDGVGMVGYAAAEADDGDDARGVAFEVGDVGLGRGEQVVRDDLALVVLEPAVLAHLLDANALVRELTLSAPSVTLLGGRCDHVDQVVLAGPELCEDQHARTRAVDAGALVEDLGRRPRIVDPDGGISADPVGDEWRIVFLGQRFEVDPGLGVGELEGVADDGERERAGRLRSFSVVYTVD